MIFLVWVVPAANVDIEPGGGRSPPLGSRSVSAVGAANTNKMDEFSPSVNLQQVAHCSKDAPSEDGIREGY